jgi:hypothetical protein
MEGNWNGRHVGQGGQNEDSQMIAKCWRTRINPVRRALTKNRYDLWSLELRSKFNTIMADTLKFHSRSQKKC